MPEGLRARLTLTFGGLTLIAVALFAVVIALVLERLLVDRLSEDLEAQARLVAGQIGPDLREGDARAVDAALVLVDAATAARAVAVDADGRLVGASEPEDRRSVGQPFGQSDIAPALRGEVVRERLPRRGSSAEVLVVTMPVVTDGQLVGAVRLAYQLRDIQATLDRLNVGIGLGAIGVALVASLMAAGFAEAISTPIRRLSGAAQALAGGDLRPTITTRSRGEVGQLVDAFNGLAASLREFEAARTEFAADISHELRALAGAMRAATDALLQGADRDPDLRAELLAGLHGHTGRLGRLTDDLVQLARLEGGRLEMLHEPVCLADVARQVGAEWAAEAALQGVELRLASRSTKDDDVRVLGDHARLVQAAGNLVENALKYAADGGWVRVEVLPGRRSHVLEVADNGHGIPPDELPHIFHRFYRVEGRAGSGPSGMGLGLAIVDRIVRAHGGAVTVASVVGEGSTFRIRLPALSDDLQISLSQPQRPSDVRAVSS